MRARWLLALAATATLAACGDDEGNRDADEISAVIERVSTTADAAACTEVQTQRFLEQIAAADGLKGKAAVSSCRANAGQGVAKRVRVSDVAVDGDRATANAAIQGATFDGQTLKLAFVKDGDAWKLDRLTGFADFDRTKLIASLTREVQSAGGMPPELATCVKKAMQRLDTPTLQAYFVTPSPALLGKVFGPCEKHMGG